MFAISYCNLGYSNLHVISHTHSLILTKVPVLPPLAFLHSLACFLLLVLVLLLLLRRWELYLFAEGACGCYTLVVLDRDL